MGESKGEKIEKGVAKDHQAPTDKYSGPNEKQSKNGVTEETGQSSYPEGKSKGSFQVESTEGKDSTGKADPSKGQKSAANNAPNSEADRVPLEGRNQGQSKL